jgi:hypothetical protein
MEKKYVERALRLPLDVEVNCDGNQMFYSKNISETGIAIISDSPLAEGKIIQMKFHLPCVEKAVNAYGKVVRTAPVSENYFESGISFRDISEDDKKLLKDFFDSAECC